VTKPLAFLLYEQLLPGSQLLPRLEDIGYRVRVVADPAQLVRQAEEEKPMIVLVDLVTPTGDFCERITELKKNPATAHIPVLAFTGQANAKLQQAARVAGATLVASDDAILTQLPQLLEQALQVE
jgi:two-component system cell cycle response regulator DivK